MIVAEIIVEFIEFGLARGKNRWPDCVEQSDMIQVVFAAFAAFVKQLIARTLMQLRQCLYAALIVQFQARFEYFGRGAFDLPVFDQLLCLLQLCRKLFQFLVEVDPFVDDVLFTRLQSILELCK